MYNRLTLKRFRQRRRHVYTTEKNDIRAGILHSLARMIVLNITAMNNRSEGAIQNQLIFR